MLLILRVSEELRNQTYDRDRVYALSNTTESFKLLISSSSVKRGAFATISYIGKANSPSVNSHGFLMTIKSSKL